MSRTVQRREEHAQPESARAPGEAEPRPGAGGGGARARCLSLLSDPSRERLRSYFVKVGRPGAVGMVTAGKSTPCLFAAPHFWRWRPAKPRVDRTAGRRADASWGD